VRKNKEKKGGEERFRDKERENKSRRRANEQACARSRTNASMRSQFISGRPKRPPFSLLQQTAERFVIVVVIVVGKGSPSTKE